MYKLYFIQQTQDEFNSSYLQPLSLYLEFSSYISATRAKEILEKVYGKGNILINDYNRGVK